MAQASPNQARPDTRTWESEYRSPTERSAAANIAWRKANGLKIGKGRERKVLGPMTQVEKDFASMGHPVIFSATPTDAMLAEAEALAYARLQMSEWNRFLGDPPPGYSALDFIQGTYKGRVLTCQDNDEPSGTTS